MQLIEDIKPDQCTLVPDDPTQLTSDHGWNIIQNHNILAPILKKLHAWTIRSSVFLDADPSQIPLAQKLGIQRVELYTGPYAEHFNPEQPRDGLADYQETARAADQAGIGVNAGHDLNLVNLPSFVAGIPALKEVSIGHALITDALWLGLPKTIERYLKAVNRADGL